MPATAGRVKMPHNNRVSAGAALKTSDMWSKTIGHNPYANEEESADAAAAAADAEKAKSLLELARLQNVAGRSREGGGDGASSAANDFAKRSWLGLKNGKKRRAEGSGGAGGTAGALGGYVAGEAGNATEYGHVDSSSSEDEFVDESVEEPVATSAAVTDMGAAISGEEWVEKKPMSNRDGRRRRKRSGSKRRRKKKRRRSSSSSYNSGSLDSDDSSSSHGRREKRRRKKKRTKERDDQRRRVKKRSNSSRHRKSR